MKDIKYYILFLVSLWLATLVNPAGFLYEDDEGAYLYVCTAISQGKRLYSDVHASKPPFIFFLGSLIYKVVGNNIVVFRYTASLFGLLVGLLIFFMTKKMCGSFGALICSLIFLVDPLAFTQVRLFRTDIFMIFFITASFYCFSNFRNNKGIIFGSLFSSLAVLSRDDAILYVILITLFCLFKKREKKIVLGLLFTVCVFVLSLLFRGADLVIGSFSQQVNVSDVNLLNKAKNFMDFLTYMTKQYPVWLLFPVVIIPIIKIKIDNHSIFTLFLIVLNLIMIFVSESHFIRYVLVLVIGRVLIVGDLLKILEERYKIIIGLLILLFQIIVNPPPIREFSFRDDTIIEISSYLRGISFQKDVLLADYGYFNFHSGLDGTSISGYISGGNVRTGEINADRIIDVITKENVKFLLIHTEGRLYYPYGAELYYYEPHHIKGIRDFEKLERFIEGRFVLVKSFKSPKGPKFDLYKRMF